MVVACWAAKGGSGTTVVATALALVQARAGHGRVVLCDLAGDVPAAMGLPEPDGPGVTELFAEPDAVPPDALARLLVPAAPGLAILTRGRAPIPPTGGALLLALLDAIGTAVVDCGTLPTGLAAEVAAAASRSILVTRPCYLALRRAMAAPARASDVILVHEPGRALGVSDVESVLGIPVRAEIGVEPAIARAVDAGLLVSRLPRALERGLARVG